MAKTNNIVIWYDLHDKTNTLARFVVINSFYTTFLLPITPH